MQSSVDVSNARARNPNSQKPRGGAREPSSDPPRGEDDGEEHERRFDELRRPFSESPSRPENPNRPEHESDAEDERKIECGGLQNLHDLHEADRRYDHRRLIFNLAELPIPM